MKDREGEKRKKGKRMDMRDVEKVGSNHRVHGL